MGNLLCNRRANAHEAARNRLMSRLPLAGIDTEHFFVKEFS
jgi:hypothetical protein